MLWIRGMAQKAINIAANWASEQEPQFRSKKTEIVQFIHKRNPDLGSLLKNGSKLPLSKEARLLGVTLDSKLAWKPHITRITHQATTGLMQCWQILGKMWEIKPSMMKWIYTLHSYDMSRGVFRGGHGAMAPPPLGRQDSIMSIKKYEKLWHGPPFVTRAESLSTQKENLGKDLFFFWSSPNFGQEKGLILSGEIFFGLHYFQISWPPPFENPAFATVYVQSCVHVCPGLAVSTKSI